MSDLRQNVITEIIDGIERIDNGVIVDSMNQHVVESMADSIIAMVRRDTGTRPRFDTMTDDDLIRDAGWFGLTNDAESYPDRMSLVAAIDMSNDW